MSLTLQGPPLAAGRLDPHPATLLDFHSPTQALAVTPILHAARSIAIVIAALIACCFAAAVLLPIDKVVTATGRVVAQRATTVLQPLETAIVRNIEVREGDRVAKGTLLARLDPTFAAADMAALQSQVASLRMEVGRLQAEADGVDFHPDDASPVALLQNAIFIQRKAERSFKNENYAQKINSQLTQVQRALSDVFGYGERLKVATEVEHKRLELERLQVGSQLNRLAATDSRLEIQRGYSSATAQASQAQRDLQALEAERDAYNQNWKAQVSQELTDQSRKLSDAAENLKKASRRKQLVELRAEEDSVVLSVAKVSPGSVMQSGEQVISLVPADAPLEIEANIAGADVGFVHTGNPVTVKLDTLPYTHYGTIAATVQVVSPDSFTGNGDPPARGAASDPAPPGAHFFFRAHLSIDALKLHDTPAGFRLMPGMPVVADVKVGEHTMVGYLLGRVLPAFTNGMREP